MKLKLVGDELGIPWQTVYIHLKKAGVAVTGDKSRHGSETDKLAARGETIFQGAVISAKNLNKDKFQSAVDFDVFGYGVDIKTSRKKKTGKNCYRWMFSVKKQKILADFFVCFGMNLDAERLERVFLIPGELVRSYTTLSISESTKGKWWDYEVRLRDLNPFFLSLP